MEGHASPLVLDEQILARGQRLNTLGEPRDEVIVICRKRLPGNRLHNGEHVLRAVVYLAQKDFA